LMKTRAMDPAGVAPASPVCKTGILLLNDGPEDCVGRLRSDDLRVMTETGIEPVTWSL
jgi:hypothetical protein